MTSTIHQPRALLDWQTRVVRARVAHLYRISHDGRGNWTVTRPGSNERLYFPAAPAPVPAVAQPPEPASRPAIPQPAAKRLTSAEKYAAEVRSSYGNLSA